MDSFGDTLILTYGWDLAINQQISLTLNRSDNKFKTTDSGEGYLNQLGFDRVFRPETEPEPEDHPLGSMLVKGVAYGLKNEFRAALQLLTQAEADAIKDMVTLQRSTGRLIRLSDRILPYAEPAPRTRPISLAYSNPHPNPGMVYYYADFLIWLRIANIQIFDCDRWEMDLVAIEYEKPLNP